MKEGVMFKPDPNQWSIQMVSDTSSLRFKGGVAPSRHEVALAANIEKQSAHRHSPAAQQEIPLITTGLRRYLEMARRLIGMVGHTDGRFGISGLRGGES